MKRFGLERLLACSLLFGVFVTESFGQETAPPKPENETGQITLRKSVRSREYQGRAVEGEDRLVGPGDSIWRMLVQERGVPEKRFAQYLVIIKGLNPQIKNLDVLRIGDNVFIPMRLDELLGGQMVTAKKETTRTPIAQGTTRDYRVKSGDRLYQILREQLGLKADRDLALNHALVKDLNPEKKNWDVLLEGEIIRLPVPAEQPDSRIARSKGTLESSQGTESKPSPEPKPAVEVKAAPVIKPTTDETKRDQEVATITSPKPSASIPIDYPHRVPARQNVALLTQVIEALGNEVQRSGEEVLSLKEGTIRLEKNTYPVVYSPKLNQKIILDLQEAIPAALRSRLASAAMTIPVFPVSAAASLQTVVSQLLSGLGYQPLPVDRPIVISDAGVMLEVKGSWIALAPEETNKAQEIFVITVSDRADEIPDYLKKELSRKGVHVRDIVLPSSARELPADGNHPADSLKATINRWPLDKREFIDAMLMTLRIPFGVAERLTVELHEGLRLDITADRIFDAKGKQTALVFQRVEPEIKKELQERRKLTLYEIDISTLSRKEIFLHLLSAIGEQATYREHRFAAGNGANQDRLNIAAWGFLLANRGMFVTDREIPEALHRFFFEKGLQIVYF